MEEQDWDLHAVVRSCATSNSTTITTITTTTTGATTSCSLDTHQPICNFQPRQDDENNSFCSQDLYFDSRFTHNTFFEDLHELCKPFFIEDSSSQQQLQLPQQSTLSVLGGLQNLSPKKTLTKEQQKPLIHQLNTRHIQTKRPFPTISTTNLHAQSPRTKRRKNQLKKVCQVAADALSSDMWSWRKYGQKPIKGSPYPRGYYKCSTSKGCLARKQVERNRSDPNMFIVSYTAEHNHPMPTHRNSLAGVSRHKTVNSETGMAADSSSKPTSSSPVTSPATNSVAPENQGSSREDKEDIFEDDDDEDEFGVTALDNMEPDDDFFEGLEELVLPAAGDSLPVKFPGTMQFSWLANTAATTAAGNS